MTTLENYSHPQLQPSEHCRVYTCFGHACPRGLNEVHVPQKFLNKDSGGGLAGDLSFLTKAKETKKLP